MTIIYTTLRRAESHARGAAELECDSRARGSRARRALEEARSWRSVWGGRVHVAGAGGRALAGQALARRALARQALAERALA